MRKITLVLYILGCITFISVSLYKISILPPFDHSELEIISLTKSISTDNLFINLIYKPISLISESYISFRLYNILLVLFSVILLRKITFSLSTNQKFADIAAFFIFNSLWLLESSKKINLAVPIVFLNILILYLISITKKRLNSLFIIIFIMLFLIICPLIYKIFSFFLIISFIVIDKTNDLFSKKRIIYLFTMILIGSLIFEYKSFLNKSIFFTTIISTENQPPFLFSNELATINQLFSNYFNSFSFHFLFSRGSNIYLFKPENTAPFNLILFLFFYLGLLSLFKLRLRKLKYLILFWLVFLPLSLAIFKESINEKTFYPMFYLFAIVTALGLSYFFNYIKTLNNLLYKPVIILLISGYLYFYFYSLHMYFDHFPRHWEWSQNTGYEQVADLIFEKKKDHRGFIFTQEINTCEMKDFLNYFFKNKYKKRIEDFNLIFDYQLSKSFPKGFLVIGKKQLSGKGKMIKEIYYQVDKYKANSPNFLIIDND